MWATIGHIVEDNPDLTYSYISNASQLTGERMVLDAEDSPEVVKVFLSSKSYVYLSKMVHVYFEAMRAIFYQREIYKLFKEDANESYLMQLSSTNYDMAVISWCKLFGAKSSQHTHYLHLLEKPDLTDCLKNLRITNQQELKTNLLNGIDVSEQEFEGYLRKSILKYRNQFVAHFDLDLHIKKYDEPKSEEVNSKLLKEYPKFDIAIKSLDWLYDLISRILRCRQGNGRNAKDWAIFTAHQNNRRILKEIAPLIKKIK